MGTGPMTSLSFRYLSEKGSSLTMGFRGYALYDFEAQIQENAPEPSTGWEFIGVSNLSFEIPLSKIARVGVSDELYMKRAFYKKVPDVFQWLNSVGVFAKMQLK